MRKKNGYAIPAFNIVNLDMIIAAISAAEAESSSVIIEYTEADDKRIPIEIIGFFGKKLAEQSKVDVCLHFDHGTSTTGIERAIASGFSSVMIDSSELSFEENIKITREIVEMCHSRNISVEGELGKIESGDENFTQVNLVKEFVDRTKIDALAISFGTEHGVYKNEPEIKIDLVSSISELTSVPLVMHGGSGLPRELYYEVISRGVVKINYYSAMSNKVLNKVIGILNNEIPENERYLQNFVDLELKYFKEEMQDIIKLFRKEK